MTREEIIHGLQFTIDMFLLDTNTGETLTEPRNELDKITIEACRGAIQALEQEPKTGHWIEKTGEEFEAWAECSECGCVNPLEDDFNYCPNCGVKMEVKE